MSSHRPLLSEKAELDFQGILKHAGEKWGCSLFYAYYDTIEGSLEHIGRYPYSGTPVPGLPDNYRMFFVGSHVIIYEPRDDQACVVRILHQRLSRDQIFRETFLTKEEMDDYQHQRTLVALAQVDAGMGIPHEEVVAYFDSLDTDNPLPKPVPRKLPDE